MPGSIQEQRLLTQPVIRQQEINATNDQDTQIIYRITKRLKFLHFLEMKRTHTFGKVRQESGPNRSLMTYVNLLHNMVFQ